MLPDGPQLLEALVSLDPERSSRALHESVVENDREVLAWLAPHADEILAAVDATTYPPAIVARRSLADLVVTRLGLAAAGDCLCLAYPTSSLVSMRGEADRRQVEVVSSRPDPEIHATTYVCRCRRCGRGYEVVETTDWHRPMYRWTPIRFPIAAHEGPLPPYVEAIVADVTSGRRDRLDAGLDAIAATSVAADLIALASRQVDLMIAVAGADWGSGVDEDSAGRYRADLQLDRLDAIVHEGCDCAALPGIWKGRPSLEDEVAVGRMERIGESEGRCRRCGATYVVEAEPGRRFPVIATWTRTGDGDESPPGPATD